MAFQIQDRINVPGNDQKQGVILGVSTGLGHQTLYVVTWLDDSGVQFTQTFGAHNVDEANPAPVDVEALTRKLEAATAQARKLNEKVARMNAARRSAAATRAAKRSVSRASARKSKSKSRKRK